MQAAPKEIQAYQDSGRRIRDGWKLSNSIDNFMDNHQSDKRLLQLGRLGIARAIGHAELKSKLYIKPDDTELKWNQIADTWIVKLFKRLQEGRPREDVGALFENTSFVIFNYDRCVEHFFFYALQAAYAISRQDAAEIVLAAEIVHPYGIIGSLDWEPYQNAPGVPFGPANPPLGNMASGIRTYTEQLENADDLDRIHSLVASAETICFLGFSYQPQNVQLVTSERESRAVVIGTAYHISEFDVQRIAIDLNKRLWGSKRARDREMHLANKLTCGEFLDHFSRAFG